MSITLDRVLSPARERRNFASRHVSSRRTKWSGGRESNPVRCFAFLRESGSNASTYWRFPRTRCSRSGRQYAGLCSSNFSILGRPLKDFCRVKRMRFRLAVECAFFDFAISEQQ